MNISKNTAIPLSMVAGILGGAGVMLAPASMQNAVALLFSAYLLLTIQSRLQLFSRLIGLLFGFCTITSFLTINRDFETQLKVILITSLWGLALFLSDRLIRRLYASATDA